MQFIVSAEAVNISSQGMAARKTGDRKAAPQLTHLDSRGRIRMVDVGEKPITRREAIARGRVTMARATLAAANPGGRLVTPQEVADAVLWLASPRAAAVTGQAIAIAG